MKNHVTNIVTIAAAILLASAIMYGLKRWQDKRMAARAVNAALSDTTDTDPVE